MIPVTYRNFNNIAKLLIREIVPVLLRIDYKMLKGFSYTIYEISLQTRAP